MNEPHAPRAHTPLVRPPFDSIENTQSDVDVDRCRCVLLNGDDLTWLCSQGTEKMFWRGRGEMGGDGEIASLVRSLHSLSAAAAILDS